MADKLDKIRQQLDETDKRIIDALAKRQQLVREVSSFKIDEKKNIRDMQREEQLLHKITKLARQAGLDRYFAEQLFKDIINHSVRFQTHTLVDYQNGRNNAEYVRVAYQGTEGDYSGRGALRQFEVRYLDVHTVG